MIAFANAKIYNGIEVGVLIPLWFGAQSSRIRASNVQTQVLEAEMRDYQKRLSARVVQLFATLDKHQKSIGFYRTEGQELAKGILSHAHLAFQGGEIDFLQFLQLLENAKNIEISYLENLHAYNQTVLDINHIMITEEL